VLAAPPILALTVREALSAAVLRLTETDEGRAALETLFDASGIAPADNPALEAWTRFVTSSRLPLATMDE
jgi:hypothetical protein